MPTISIRVLEALTRLMRRRGLPGSRGR
jgi:hypothetical protein